MIRAQDRITIDVTDALDGIAAAMQALREIELAEQRWEDAGGAIVRPRSSGGWPAPASRG